MRFRFATEHDLATCRGLLHPGLRMDDRVRDQLPRLWTELLSTGLSTFSVIEDPARPHPESIEAFGLSVFVTDAFAARFHEKPRPYLPAIVYEETLAGRSPVLSPAQIREANSTSGLNLAVLHFGLRNPDMSDPRTQLALQTGGAAFYFVHSGYRLKGMLHEVYGEQQAEFIVAGGGVRLRSDFPEEAVTDLGGTPRPHRPFLFVLRQEWMAAGAANPLSFLFHTPRPQFGFTPTEQAVALRALLSESDIQIAAALGLPLDAVKKVWRRVYERATTALPYLLDEVERTAANDGRGQEKRRHLLEYLRTHLEELRPYKGARSPKS